MREGTQQFLGHADPATTRKYIGLTSEQLVSYSERASVRLFEAMEKGETKFSRNGQRINYAEEERQYLLNQLKTKDELLRALTQQMDLLTRLLAENQKVPVPHPSITENDDKVILLSSRRKAKTGR